MAVKKVYAVRKGRQTGLFQTWSDCQQQIIGFSGAEYKSFKTLEEAEQYMEGSPKVVSHKGIDTDDGNPSSEVIMAYVDGSYNSKTHQYGSGLVVLWKGTKKGFSFVGGTPELASMRNVAGEIIAAQRAMEFALVNGATKVIIFYDYEGIEKWCTGAWEAKKEGTQAYASRYQEIKKEIGIEFVKVEAHSGDRYNEEADMLAKKAVGLL